MASNIHLHRRLMGPALMTGPTSKGRALPPLYLTSGYGPDIYDIMVARNVPAYIATRK